jgi:hypothetical protein
MFSAFISVFLKCPVLVTNGRQRMEDYIFMSKKDLHRLEVLNDIQKGSYTASNSEIGLCQQAP